MRWTVPRGVRTIAAVALAAASLVWLWRAAEPDAVWPLLERAHPLALVMGVILLAGSLVAKALRWRAMLPEPWKLSRVEAVRIFHVSILLNNLLPFRVGDGARVLSPSVRRVATLQQALVALVAERVIDGLALSATAVVVLPLFFRATGRQAVIDGITAPGNGAVLVLMGGFLAGLVGLAVVARIRWAALRVLLRERIKSLREDALAVVQQPPRHLALLGWATAFAWGATFGMHYFVLEALNAPPSIVNPIVLAVIVTLSTNLSMLAPATPGGIGLFHAAAAAPLLVAGVSSDVAVAYALLVHVINTVPPMLVGAVGLAGPSLAARFRRA
ncbi:MAG: flippase-like domain-containing protein [Dehalococcoidia bacterium]|nr:flippase-like domain-containing protein [Dehalococcoidia bacterium]